MESLTSLLKVSFEACQNPEKARAMKAYMKDHFPFFGIPSEERKRIQKEVFDQVKPHSFETLEGWVLELWSLVQREFQYAAIDLMLAQKKLWNPNLPLLVEKLIQTKSWWDTVDALANPVFGAYLLKFKAIESDRINPGLPRQTCG
jgi:3-methyladenine DNA glycosylase AlkD